jgi:hypothetical protein
MKKAAVILGITVVLLGGDIAWQVGACYMANIELQSDLKDLAVQNPGRIGLRPFDTEEELREKVIAKAKGHGIELAPEQVRVKRNLTPEWLDVSLATDYEARVKLLVVSVPIHFSAASSHSGKIVVK